MSSKQPQLEVRYVPASELRVAAGDKPRIVGYPIVFDSPSEIINVFGFRFREIIHAEAVKVPLAPGADVRGLVDHNPQLLLGRTKSGTLRYEIQKRGVRMEVDPPDTSYARDILESIRRGDTDGMSFRFAIAKDGDRWDESKDIPERHIFNIREIAEFSVVTFPAYPETDVALRSLEAFRAAAGLKLADARLRLERALII